jgi:hypothetical protein
MSIVTSILSLQTRYWDWCKILLDIILRLYLFQHGPCLPESYPKVRRIERAMISVCRWINVVKVIPD